ncbi:MAG TPA: M67 family metallopeptidase [Terriglobia bacterium]|jgi:proteasome lid subunit RPN8/RPN11|nr:M67 family metallopeptidase [Terriglobia bacterium]
MAIRLKPDQLKSIRSHGESDYPNECCGMLLGHAEGDSKEVLEVVPLRNLRHDSARAQELLPLDDPGRESERNRFLIDPLDQLRVEKDALARGLDVLGYYHSHPDHPARPSNYDREHAWPWYSYIILSVERGRANEITSWVLSEDRERFDPEPLNP